MDENVLGSDLQIGKIKTEWAMWEKITKSLSLFIVQLY